MVTSENLRRLTGVSTTCWLLSISDLLLSSKGLAGFSFGATGGRGFRSASAGLPSACLGCVPSPSDFSEVTPSVGYQMYRDR